MRDTPYIQYVRVNHLQCLHGNTNHWCTVSHWSNELIWPKPYWVERTRISSHTTSLLRKLLASSRSWISRYSIVHDGLMNQRTIANASPRRVVASNMKLTCFPSISCLILVSTSLRIKGIKSSIYCLSVSQKPVSSKSSMNMLTLLIGTLARTEGFTTLTRNTCWCAGSVSPHGWQLLLYIAKASAMSHSLASFLSNLLSPSWCLEDSKWLFNTLLFNDSSSRQPWQNSLPFETASGSPLCSFTLCSGWTLWSTGTFAWYAATSALAPRRWVGGHLSPPHKLRLLGCTQHAEKTLCALLLLILLLAVRGHTNSTAGVFNHNCCTARSAISSRNRHATCGWPAVGHFQTSCTLSYRPAGFIAIKLSDYSCIVLDSF